VKQFLKYTIRLAVFILAQVYVLNQIPALHAYITPSIYFLFILWLPFTISRGGLLLVSFITGIMLDFFMKTPGLHAAPCVLIGYLRPFFINILMPQQGVEFNYREPSALSLGLVQYMIYVALLSFFHHLYLFTIEAFQFGDIIYLLSKTIGSLAISLLMILVVEIIFIRKQKFLTNT